MNIPFYIGTMNRPANLMNVPHARGIYRSFLNSEDGSFGEACELAAELESPTFLAVHPSLRVLYAVSSDSQNGPEDLISAFRIEKNGTLEKISECPSCGKNPCHVTIHPSGKWLFAPNYSSGNAVILPLAADGTFLSEKEKHLFLYENVSRGTGRQEAPHPHCFTLSPDGRFAAGCDLGCDRIYMLHFDVQNSEWNVFSDFPFVSAPSGSGPRHAVFSMLRNRLYVFNELSCTLDVYRFQPESGFLQFLHGLTVLPPTDWNGKSTKGQGAEIVLHPSGRFLYVSTRISDSITVFEEDDSDVSLHQIQYLSAGGEIPRHITFDPDGRWLLASCQKTGRIFSFSVSLNTGYLTPTGFSLSAPWCACTVFHTTFP